MSFQQAGARAPPRRAGVRCFGAGSHRFSLRFDDVGENLNGDTHVDSCGEGLSDAGSTPAASIRLTFRLPLASRRFAHGKPFDMSNALSEGAKRPSRRAPSPRKARSTELADAAADRTVRSWQAIRPDVCPEPLDVARGSLSDVEATESKGSWQAIAPSRPHVHPALHPPGNRSSDDAIVVV